MDPVKQTKHKVQNLDIKHEEWVEKMARAGYLAKGAIYILIGVLSAMAAFGAGGQSAGKTEAFKVIEQQPFGQVLLVLVAIGFIGYAVWRYVQAFKDTENKGTDTKGLFQRIGFAFSGVLYLSFAFYALKMVFGNSGGGGGQSGRQQLIGELLSQPFGQILVGLLALFAIGKGVNQLYKGFKKGFMKEIRGVSGKERELYERAGQVGYISRGVVLGIIGFFMGRAAILSSASQAKGTEGVFDFLGSAGGPWLMGLIAIGVVAYGAFQIVKAKYKPIKT